MSWNSVPAAELMVKRGGSVNPSKFPEETFELLSIPAFDKGEPEVLKGSQIGSSKSCIEPGDVLLSKIVPHIRRCWVVPNKGEHRQIGSGEWIIFRDDRFDSGFLRHFLTSNMFHSQFMNTVAGVGGSLIRARPAGVELIEIPLPRLAEQKRIAAILDKADAIRRKRQQAIKLADDFLRAVFLDMFGDPVTNPKGWEEFTLPEIAEKFTDGPFGSNLKSSHYVEDGVRVIRLQNIGVGCLLDENLAFISEDHFQSLPRNQCKPGDVIIGTLGEPNLRACIIPKELQSALNKADCLLYRPLPDRALSEYICWLLNSTSLVKRAAGLVRGQTRGRISLGRLKELKVPLPPLAEQEKFRSIVLKLADIQSGIDSSNNIFVDALSSLSQKAFSGNL